MDKIKNRELLSIQTFALLVLFAACSALLLLRAEEIRQRIGQLNGSSENLLFEVNDKKTCKDFHIRLSSQAVLAGVYGFLSSVVPLETEEMEYAAEITIIPSPTTTSSQFVSIAEKVARERHALVAPLMPYSSIARVLRSGWLGNREAESQEVDKATLKLTLQQLKASVPMKALVSSDSQAAAASHARSEKDETQRHVPASMLPDYQKKGVEGLLRLLLHTRDVESVASLTLLENGCDVTGAVGQYLSQYVGTYVGVNCGFENKDVPENLKHSAENAIFISTDCGPLPFQDNSFDVVFSDNVLEHAQPVDLFLRESHRVLKQGGIAYFSWGPIWTGPFGHHVHEDMVQRRAKRLNTTSTYRNDGTVIPPWGHLLFSPEELREQLSRTKGFGTPQLIDGILQYVYSDANLNRVGFSQILRMIESFDWKPVPGFHACETAGDVHGLDHDSTLPSFKEELPSEAVWRPILDLSRLDRAVEAFPNETRFDVGFCRLAFIKP